MTLHYRIIENFEKEHTIWELSQKYNIKETELKEKLKEYYSSKNNIKKFYSICYNIENNKAKNNIKSIIEEFENGAGTRILAKRYNTTRYNIRDILLKYYDLINNMERYNYLVNKNNNSKGNMKYTLTKEMINDFNNGISAKKISEENNIPYTCLRRLLIKENLIKTEKNSNG